MADRKPEFTLENLVKYKVITQEKADIIAHKAKVKSFIGAKGSGKTFVALLEMVYILTHNKMTHFYGFRKYKTNASAKMSEYIAAVINAVERVFGSIGKFKATGNIVQKIKSKTDKMKNQQIKFGSLEDVSGTTDGGRPAFGYIAGVLIDECVIRKDMIKGQIPSKEDWEQDLTIITDNLERSKDAYDFENNTNVDYKEWHTLNPWPGKHPKLVECEKILPEADFIKFVLGYSYSEILGNIDLIEKNWDIIIHSIKKNSVMSVYDSVTDHLVIRNTKFANPTLSSKNEKIVLNKIKQSLLDKDINTLTILLGFESKEKLDASMMAYDLDMDDFKQNDYKTLLKEGYKPIKVNYAIDVDTSRVFTISTAVLMEKMAVFDKSERKSIIYIAPIMEIYANGSGIYGERNLTYINLIQKYIDKNILQYYNINKNIKTSLVIDDKRKWFLYELWKLHKEGRGLPFIKKMNTFLQHGEYNILNRQDWFTSGIKNKRLVFDPKNKPLFDDVMNCIREEVNSPKRATRGNTNYNDRIDSVENAFLPFVRVLLKRII